MDSFGKRLAACRKAKNLSQKELAEIFNTSHTTIGKYERDEMTPSIEAAKKLAKILDTTVGYLLGETDRADLFKDPAMLQRLQDILNLPSKEKECLLMTVDHFIKAAKINLI
jgi:transcriptional regulator with XRE-family HTH domain